MHRRFFKASLAAIILSLILFLENVSLFMTVSAAESEQNIFTDKQGVVYMVNNNKMEACVYYTDKEAKYDTITIPDKITVNGLSYTVAYIDDMVFTCTAKKIIVPKTVVEIGICAFRDCATLENITVDSANEYYCSSDGILFDKQKTQMICFPSSKKVTSYSIPSTVKVIDSNAFYQNQYIKSIIIPPSVQEIYWGAFAGDTNLQNIKMTPENFTMVESYAFSGTKWESDKPNNEDIYLGSIAYRCRKDIGGSNTYSFKEGTTFICEDFFFEELNKIKNIYLPQSVNNISGLAFKHCPELLTITVAESNQTFSTDNNGILYDKSKSMLICYPRGKKDEKFTVPDGVKRIYWYAFYKSTLTEIILPEGLKTIDTSAFEYSKLTSVTISGSVETIGDSAFSMCFDLQKVIIKNGVKEIYDKAFEGCYINNIVIPESVTYIGSNVFAEDRTILSRKGSYTETYCKENELHFADYIEKLTKGIDDQYGSDKRLGSSITTLKELYDILDESDKKLITNKNKLDELIAWSDFVSNHPRYRDAFIDRRLYIKAAPGVLPEDIKPDAVVKELSKDQLKDISELTGRESVVLGSFELKLVNKNGDQVAASTDIGKSEGTYNLNADIAESEFGNITMIFIDMDGKVTEVPVTIADKEATFEVKGSGMYALIKKGEPVKDSNLGIILACSGGAVLVLLCVIIIAIVIKKKKKAKKNVLVQPVDLPAQECAAEETESETAN